MFLSKTMKKRPVTFKKGHPDPYKLKDLLDEDKLYPGKGEDKWFSKFEFTDIGGSLIQTKNDALHLLEEAEKKADRYLMEARKKIPMIEKEAYEKGFFQGEQSGLEIGERKIKAIADNFSQIVAELGKIKRKIYQDNEKEIIDMAIKISEKIVHQEISLNNEVIVSVAKAAISQAVDRENLIIKINPADFETVLKYKPKIMDSMDGINVILLKKDEGILRGGCVVETDFGDIDAQIDHQQEEVKNTLDNNPRG